jgi:membrane protein
MALPGNGIGWKEFFKNLKEEWSRDNVGNVAGAVTYFGVLAIFPFLLFMVALASVILDPASAQELVRELARVAPPQVTQILGDRLKALGEQNSVGLLTVGAAGALFSASGGIVALMGALNTVYGVKESRPVWKVRGIAFLAVLATAVIGVLAAAIAVAAPALGNALGAPFDTLITWLRLPVAGLLMMSLWACIYYFLPDVEQKFRFITPGSVVGVLIWVIASYGFSFYVSRFGKYDATYGALGGVIVLLLWMWISSQVLLLGAEINAIIEHKSPEGKGAGARTEAEPAPTATKSEVEDSGGAVEAPPPGAPLTTRQELKDRQRPPAGPRPSWGKRMVNLALGAVVVLGLRKLGQSGR